jgi:NADPH-dependent glutamate synthase beta subunit-like oxidoreductase
VPWLAPAVAAATFDEANPGYTRELARAEASRASGLDLSSATEACPFHVDAAELVEATARGDFDAALVTARRAHPWPGIMGRACHAFCEREQRVPEGVETIAIRELERAAATFGRAPTTRFDPPASGRTVAVVGAGSAGAGVAYELRALGHEVVLYEQLPEAGGMMAIGYPQFRLPIEVVRAEAPFEEWGVKMRYGIRVDRPQFERIATQHDAVVVTTGKFEAHPLEIPGAELAGAYDAIGFLTRFRLGEPIDIGRRAIVIGGGNTALDVSRTLKRLGSDVRIAYRRGQSELNVRPAAQAAFVRYCAGEGIPIDFWTAIVRLVGRYGRVVGAVCATTRPGPGDDSGRPTAELVPGSERTIDCDLVVAAIGERVDVSFLPPDLRLRDGLVEVDDRHMTSLPGVFAAGEVVAGLRGTEMAFADGMATAHGVDRYIRPAE